MPDLTYLDFDLEFEREPNGGYRVEVTRAPAGNARAEFTLPFSDVEIENVLLKLGGARRRVRRVESAEMDTAKNFGGKLFNAVFTGDVRSVYAASMQEANARDVGLRVRLHLDDAPELADLPWEFLYNPSLNRFLALSNKTPLVRYIELPEQIRPLSLHPPLNVLVMISSPTDYETLDVEREWRNLSDALRDLTQRGMVTLERVERATLAELQKKLQERAYHIFHFIGHGAFDERAQDGELVFENENARGRRVSAQTLGALLHDHASFRLAVLNACEGARTSRSDPFAGVAQSLVQQGIPAVVAMQFEISDDAAATFARGFYQAIARGFPLDAALAEVRKNIFADNNETEWGTPVLYLRAADGKIFDVQEMAAAPISTTVQDKATVTTKTSESSAALPRTPSGAKPNALSFETLKPFALPFGIAILVLLLLLGAFASGIFSPRGTSPAILGCTPDVVLSEITPPSHTQQVAPGQAFKFTWKLKNSGTCDIDRSYNLVFYSGDQMEWEWERPSFIRAGETVDVTMNLFAPSEARDYAIEWYFGAPNDKEFGPHLKYAFQVVQGATAILSPAPPSVSILSPSSNAVFQIGERIVVEVSSQDPQGVEEIQLLVDGVTAESARSPNPAQPSFQAQLRWWTTSGDHILTARAINRRGVAGDATISVRVPLPPGAVPNPGQLPTDVNLGSGTIPTPNLNPPIGTPVLPTAPTSVLTGTIQARGADNAPMVFVPAGEYTIGNDQGGDDEKPAHQVFLDAFWIDQHEVTNAQYQQCSRAGKCQPPVNRSSNTRENYFGNPQFDNYPVIFVSWSDARAYCEWAGKRLPTEAEWESVARGSDARIYPWGNEFNQAFVNSGGAKGDTAAVGSYPDGASEFGVLDLSGNVWEWVADWYSKNYYARSPRENPKGDAAGTTRGLRGGAWDTDEFFVRAPHRGDLASENSNENIGFRCAQSAAETTATPAASSAMPTLTPILATPTPLPSAPALVIHYVIPSDQLTPTEMELDNSLVNLGPNAAQEFLRVTRVAYGELKDGNSAFDVRVVVKNPTDAAIRLQVDEKFFSLQDRLGRQANLLYFCCATSETFLGAGQEREIQLVFESRPEWGGKGGESLSSFVVNGFLPVVRAAWDVPLPVTAE